jgi:hypothetical protein
MFLLQGQDEEDQEIAWEVSGNRIGICKFLKSNNRSENRKGPRKHKAALPFFMKINET